MFLMGLIRNRLGTRYILSLGNAEIVGLGQPGRRSKSKVNATAITNEFALDLSAFADSEMALA